MATRLQKILELTRHSYARTTISNGGSSSSARAGPRLVAQNGIIRQPVQDQSVFRQRGDLACQSRLLGLAA
jgi:hypothetical protein